MPAVLAALGLLLLASSLPVQGAVVLFRDGFERGLDRWEVSSPAEATVAAVPGAASSGELGLRVASEAGVVAGVDRDLGATVRVARASVDVRRHGADAARLVTLRRDGSAIVTVAVRASGRLRVSGPGWWVNTSIELPVRRWVRLEVGVDAGARKVTIATNGRVRQVIRRSTGRMDELGLAGGPGPRILSYDRLVMTAELPEPTPTPDPTPDPDPSPDGDHRFRGRGSDHGVGMSQTGAVGRAKAGQGYAAILAHYYRNTEIDTRAVEGRIVRVLIEEGARATADEPFLVCGRLGRWTVVGAEATFPGGACARFVRGSGEAEATMTVVDGAGEVLYEGSGEDRMLEPTGTDAVLEVPSKGARDRFRGSLRVLLASGRARVVNHLPLGDYLRGVVPLEMGPSRPAAALRAQAIAARSYAVDHLHPDTGTFDLHDDTRNQAYGGLRAEADPTDAAIAATAGEVVTYNGRVANTLYHAQGGGATEDARNVFTPANGSVGTDIPYLRGSLDVDDAGQPYDEGGAYDSWRTGSFTLADLSRIMSKDPRTDVGAIRRLVLSDRGVSGRLISVKLVGKDGTRKKVAGWLFKSVFNDHKPDGGPLLSTLFYLQELP